MLNKFFGRGKETSYQMIERKDQECKSGLLSSSRSSTDGERSPFLCESCTRRARPKTSKWVLAIYLVMTILNLALSSTLLAYRTPLFWKSKTYHQKKIFEHSPALASDLLELKTQVWDGALFPHQNMSIYRQPPSPEVDAAWESISDLQTFLISREDVIKVGKDPETAVRVPESWNVGEKYMAQLDGPHQLHCLNELRMQAWSHHYWPEGRSHPLHWVHLSHCLDIVRQSLMCSSSVDLLTFNWVETQNYPYYDFNVGHKCRDHGAVLQWAQEQHDKVDWINLPHVTQPKDAKVLPMEEEYYTYEPALKQYLATHTFPSKPPGNHHPVS